MRAKTAVTASEASAILGRNPHKTQAEVLKHKMQEYYKGGSEVICNEAMQFGLNQEKYAIEEYLNRYSLLDYECNKFIFIENNRKIKNWGATPDILLEDRGVQIKTKYYPMVDPHDTPIYHREQCLFELWVTNQLYPKVKKWEIVHWINGNLYEYEEKVMTIEEATAWFEDNVLELKKFIFKLEDEVAKGEDHYKKHYSFSPFKESTDPVLLDLIRDYERFIGEVAVARDSVKNQKQDILNYTKQEGLDRVTALNYKIFTEKKSSVSWKRVCDFLKELVTYEDYKKALATSRNYKETFNIVNEKKRIL